METGRILKGVVSVVGVLAVLTYGSVARSADDTRASEQVGLVRTGSGTFSIDVEGADVRTVVRAIAEFSGRNIVVGKDVKATVRVKLNNVGWQEALRTVLRSNALDYTEEGGILRVDDAAKLQLEAVDREAARAKQMELVPLETRIIKLNYAHAAEMAAALQPSLSRRGSIQAEKRTNSLIVSDLANSVDQVEQMALKLDSVTPQIEITAKLVDVNVEALRDLGIEWNVGPATPQFFDPAGLPYPPRGIKLFNDGDQAAGGSQKTGVADPATSITYGISKSWGFIEAQLQVLEQNRKANIISNPRITTVDNREAKILVGQKIPLIVQDVAGNPVSQLQTIGIQLKVTPHLTQDKKIIMDLHPEVSDLAAKSTVQGGVIINTSEADTRVMVDDGQTAVIGGLIRTNETSLRKGFPILMDLPLIGWAFREDNRARDNRELIIFVTPRLLTALASN